MVEAERLLSPKQIIRILRFEWLCLCTAGKWTLVNWVDELGWTAVAVISIYVATRWPSGPWIPTKDDLVLSLWVIVTMFLVLLVINMLKIPSSLYDEKKNRLDEAEAKLEESAQSITDDERLRLKQAKAKLKTLAEEGREMIGQKGRDFVWFKQWDNGIRNYVVNTLNTEHKKSYGMCAVHPSASEANKPEVVDACFTKCCRWLEVMAQKATLNDLKETYRYGVD